MNLFVLNGPCGAGKSTSAAILHKRLPGSVLVEIDALRRMISAYHQSSKESWVFAIDIAKHIVMTALEDERDVIIDKMIYDVQTLDQLQQLGKQLGADVYEFIVWAEKQTVIDRANARGYKKEGLFTPEKCERFWHEIQKLKNIRKEAIIVNAETQTPEEVVESILQHVQRPD